MGSERGIMASGTRAKRGKSVEGLDAPAAAIRPAWAYWSALCLAAAFALLGSAPGIPPPDAPTNMGAVDFAGIVAPGDESGIELQLESAPPDEGLFYTVYKVRRGDTVSHIAEVYGVSVDSIVTFNRITNTRALSIGKLLKIPSMNGILYDPRQSDTVASIAKAHNISEERIREANGLYDGDPSPGVALFLPDARLSNLALREINGDLFRWPIRGWITSWYGWRNDPFTGSRSFHTGVDIGAAQGAAIYAAMEGVVSSVGFNTVSGNYVVISHHSGYTTLYAHLSSSSVRAGQRVTQQSVIGRVGNTGYSTGPHLHFTVSRHGRTINPMTVLN